VNAVKCSLVVTAALTIDTLRLIYKAAHKNWNGHAFALRIQGEPKMPQHENHDMSEVREYFLYQILLICSVQNCAELCCLVLYYLTYAKLTETGTNFATTQTVQKDDFRPPGTVVPGGLMFCCGFFFLFFCGTLRRYISEMAGAIALKLSHMIGSV